MPVEPKLSARERKFLVSLYGFEKPGARPREIIAKRRYNRDWALLTLGKFWAFGYYAPGAAFDGVHLDNTRGPDLGHLTAAGRQRAMEILISRARGEHPLL